jgi:AbrB family looped-hinge helix DNA binding protein
MQTTIDKFGRIIIPKKVRENFGLKPGTSVDIEEDKDRLVLTVAHEQPMLEYEDGILVYTGTLTGDVGETLSQVRENRIARHHFS